MTDGFDPRPDLDRERRFQLAVQKNRVLIFTLATLVALGLRALDVMEGSYLEILALGAVADASAFVFYQADRRDLGRLIPFGLDPLWLLTDLVLISWGVAITGGAESPWFPWYLANIAGAAFVAGQLPAFLVAVGDTVGYVIALAWTGDVTGLGPELYRAVGIMICLYAASFFFIRGVVTLQRKRLEIAAMRDQNLRKVDELTRLTEVLEQRTGELADANLRLREADRLKTQFLANVSHELRTPLNSIIGFSDILRARLGDTIGERHSRFLEHIHSGGEQLLSLINDILDLSKIEAGQLELSPERIPVRSAVDGVSTVLRSLAGWRDVDIVVEEVAEVPSVEADPVRFKQMLFHLVSNAVKFSHEGGVVRIRLEPLSESESPLGFESVGIAVEDEGIGIDPESREIIFEAFRQADGTSSREYQGAGLGLTLVKRFVEMHRGTIAVDSAVGKGSTFTLVIPVEYRGVEEEHDPGERLQIVEGTDTGRDRILVVEDDPTTYETISRDLARADYVPIRARSGDEALRLAKSVHPVAITLDLILPGVDGFEVLRALREDADTRRIPIIIVSMLDNRELGLTLGADDYLVKPVDGTALLDRLESLVPTGHVGPARVLVIDDDPSLHELLDAVLTAPRYDILHALAGRDGVAMAREQRPDLIVLDLMMEEMDGFEVASLLKEDDETAGVPIVVLTAKDMDAGDRRRLHGKIEALMQKADWNPVRLESVIRDVVRRRKREGIGG